MTDALQQRSRYQCALTILKNASCLGNSFYLQCSKLRRLKFPVISVCSTRRDVSMVIVAEGTFKPKDTDKITL